MLFVIFNKVTYYFLAFFIFIIFFKFQCSFYLLLFIFFIIKKIECSFLFFIFIIIIFFINFKLWCIFYYYFHFYFVIVFWMRCLWDETFAHYHSVHHSSFFTHFHTQCLNLYTIFLSQFQRWYINFQVVSHFYFLFYKINFLVSMQIFLFIFFL